MAKYYISTAIDYANSTPHLGHAYEKTLADAMARWRRMRGDDVFFLTGLDEHGQKVANSAAKLNVAPLQYCDDMAGKFQSAWTRLDIRYDAFIRTTAPAHARAAQEMFRRARAKGDIYKALYKDLYCVGCEASKQEAELAAGRCPNHPETPIQRVEEENYFFRLSRYAGPVKLLLQRPGFIEPAFRANEMLQVVEQGLQDISISRRTLTWGVPIPDDTEQVMYVWFDALTNYVTGAGFPDDGARFGRIWPADCHLIGKDISRFHTIIWPAMLMAAGLELPRQVCVHGFVNIRGEKISKSRGNAIHPLDIADHFGPDALRYFLLAEIAFGQDGDFTWEKFYLRFNSDLANDLGNLLNRVVSMMDRYRGGVFDGPAEGLPQDAEIRERVLGAARTMGPLFDGWQFHTALGEAWKAVRHVNSYLEATAPWTLNKHGRSTAVAGSLRNAAEALRILAIMLSPVIPASAGRIFEQLGLDPASGLRLDAAGTWGYIPDGTKVRKGAALFPRIELDDAKKLNGP